MVPHGCQFLQQTLDYGGPPPHSNVGGQELVEEATPADFVTLVVAIAFEKDVDCGSDADYANVWHNRDNRRKVVAIKDSYPTSQVLGGEVPVQLATVEALELVVDAKRFDS